MTIRPAAIDDVEMWNELVSCVKSENLPTLFAAVTPITIESTRKYLGSILASEGSFVLLAIEGTTALGSIDCIRKSRPENSHIADIGMCVRNGHRGLGIGKSLLEALFDRASSGGVIKKIELEVFSNNKAIKLYERAGFEIEGIRKKSIRKNGDYIDIIQMGKFI